MFSLCSVLGVKCLNENINIPESKNEAASIPRVIADPNASIKNPADAAPKIIPPLETKELIAFPFCNPCSGKTAGIIPENAGQKMPHKIQKQPLTINKTAIGTCPVAK